MQSDFDEFNGRNHSRVGSDKGTLFNLIKKANAMF